jgi:hypothetical protein
MITVTTNPSNRWCACAFALSVGMLGCQRLGQPRSVTPMPRLHVCSAVGGPPALVVAVREDNGRPAARGTTLETRDERGHVNRVTGLDVSTVRIHSRPGGLRYRVRKRGFDAPPDGEVFVRWAGCQMVSESVNVMLRRRRDAAPLRMVAIPSGDNINLGPGEYSTGLNAVVDADPGVDTTVTWHSSDPRIVTVTDDGVIRSRCLPDKREAVVTATTRAPPHLRARARITVWGDSTCRAAPRTITFVEPEH